MEPLLRSQAEQLGLKERVRFVGYVPYTGLPSIYRTADVFALLSTYEGYPKVILEALACGVPVVTTPSFRGNPHIERHLAYLQEDTPEAAAAAVQRAFSGQPVDVADVQARCDWQIKAHEVLHAYGEVKK
jgi:glycosyltransferase involved in cell wall biosynthesis